MRKVVMVGFVLLFLSAAAPSQAAYTEQWASGLVGVGASSSYSTSYAPEKALGVPDATVYGDRRNVAWSPSTSSAAQWLALRYATPVFASGAVVVESNSYGFVTSIEALDLAGNWSQVWSGTDPNSTAPSTPQHVSFSWTLTDFLVAGLRINIDPTLGARYDAIDAVKLIGTTTPIPAAVWLLGTGLVGLIGLRRRF